jgi:hypothetical protein
MIEKQNIIAGLECLAGEAEREGFSELGQAIKLIIRGSKLPPWLCKMALAAGALLMTTFEKRAAKEGK